MIDSAIEKFGDIYDGVNPRELSPLVLAYVGDAVFELFVRTDILRFGNVPVNKLNKKARGIVNATSQAEMVFRIEDTLTEEEKAVLKRGRNAKSATMPKHAKVMDYKLATGLEALFGFLYLDKKMDRLYELFKIAVLVE